MICRRNNKRVCQTDVSIDVLEQLIQNLIEPQELIQDFLTVRTVSMTTRIGRRKPDAEDIRCLAASEMMRFYRVNRECQQHFTGKRKIAQRRVILGRRRRALLRMRKYKVVF